MALRTLAAGDVGVVVREERRAWSGHQGAASARVRLEDAVPIKHGKGTVRQGSFGLTVGPLVELALADHPGQDASNRRRVRNGDQVPKEAGLDKIADLALQRVSSPRRPCSAACSTPTSRQTSQWAEKRPATLSPGSRPDGNAEREEDSEIASLAIEKVSVRLRA